MQIIDNQKDFDTACEKLLDQDALFMDTEFHRRRTYYARLSIVQIASREDQMIIDVLSGIDISGLKAILANENIVKVFHAPEQDFDIFFHLFNVHVFIYLSTFYYNNLYRLFVCFVVFPKRPSPSPSPKSLFTLTGSFH